MLKSYTNFRLVQGHKEREEWTITTQIVLLCALLTSLFAIVWTYCYCAKLLDWSAGAEMMRGLSFQDCSLLALAGLGYTRLIRELLNKWKNELRNCMTQMRETSYMSLCRHQNEGQEQVAASAARFLLFVQRKTGDRGDAEDSESFTAAARYNQLN